MNSSRIYPTSLFTMMAFVVLTPIAALMFSMNVVATEVATLDFELQVLDLDTGVVSERGLGTTSAPAGADVLITYHADRTPHAVVIPAEIQGVELAFVANVSFDNVTAASLSNLSFSAEPVDLPFTSSDTVVVRTDTGALYKLGNALEFADNVTFNFEQIQ